MFNKYRMSSVSSNLNKEVLLIIGLFIILTLYRLFRLDVLESFFLSFFPSFLHMAVKTTAFPFFFETTFFPTSFQNC